MRRRLLSGLLGAGLGLLLAVGLVAGIVVVPSGVAWADGWQSGLTCAAGGVASGAGLSATASCSAGSSTSGATTTAAPTGGPSGPTGPVCRSSVRPATSGAPGPGGSERGEWVYTICPTFTPAGDTAAHFQDGHWSWVPFASGTGSPPPLPATPLGLALTAIERAPWPTPTVETWPPATLAVVDFPTWFHDTTWGPVTAEASAGGVTSRVVATPVALTLTTLNTTDGPPLQWVAVTCPGPGAVYDPSLPYHDQHTDCAVTWGWPSATERGGRFPVTVSVTYHVTWTVVGAPGGGSLGDITRTATTAITVGEIESIGTAG